MHLSASTVRTVTAALGTAREQAIAAQGIAAWETGWASVPGPSPERCYVAMDGGRILSTDGQGREATLGMVVPVHQTTTGERRGSARYTASFEPAASVGRRLAFVAHAHHVETADQVAVRGDGAAWMWNLAAEHFPGAVQIVDWYHASERMWELGRALYGPETPDAATWVEHQLGRLAGGQTAPLADAWRTVPCRGEAALVRDAQVTSFTKQAPRMAYDQDRAAGWAIGSGMIESACKAVIGQREKGPGMRWTETGAQAVTTVRLLLFNDAWTEYWATA